MGSSILLVYKTNTGFTKKYVDWIDEAISCQTVPFDQMNNVELNNFGIIIYGAGIHAGRIQGLKEFKIKALNVASKKIVVFATGGAPYTEETVSKIKTDNFSANELNKISFFYFQSGINYDKMRFLDKIIMKTYNKILKFKNDKSDIEDGTSKAISRTYDYSSRDYIKPMIDYLSEFSN